MENKPVAWMDEEGGFYGIEDYEICKSHNLKVDLIPLYTLPQITPLTDDECEAIINKHDWFSKSWRDMAKEIHDALLKKASEK